MHAKQELESIAVAKEEYSTNISEEYEYSQEKAERVSVPKKRNARIYFIQTMKITKTNKINKRFKQAHKMWRN